MFTHTAQRCDFGLLIREFPEKYPFFLQSSSLANEDTGYDILCAYPGKAYIKTTDTTDFLLSLPELPLADNPQELPFVGGYIMYLGYETVNEIEYIDDLQQDTTLPQAYAVEIEHVLLYNHATAQTTIVSTCEEVMHNIIKDIAHISQLTYPKVLTISAHATSEDEAKFIKQVERCKEYIVNGDIFQANLSRQMHLTISKDIRAIDIYTKLMQENPAPFSAYADFAGLQILSSSPERLFSVANGIIETRPIAGTRPRGDAHTDEALKSELKHNLKEQAEHLMLLDLERNDLGRVCKYGSVAVNEVMTIESYQYVHHIVSNVIGELRDDVSFKDIIRALFPGGTITGCPKVRAMEIINELENRPRNAYTGSLGYVSKCGNMDFNILIRTITKQETILTISAGAGIVYDSIPEKELEETKHKARGMLKVFTIRE